MPTKPFHMAISSIMWLATLSFVLGYGVAHIEISSHQTHSYTFSLDQTYRPSFHFHPSKNWMNDPNVKFSNEVPSANAELDNAITHHQNSKPNSSKHMKRPMRYNGLYHIFYQHNPKGAFWSNSIVWGHSISKDLVNWFSLPHALTPTKPYDINGCWSGSATIVHHHRGKLVILYTGVDHKLHQTQNLAVPKNVSDPLLREWVKSPKNPLIAPNFANKINASSFRDPSTAWLGHDNWWRVIVGSQEWDKGVALLFLSKDLVHWVKAKHPLHSAKRNGMWECPDFFPVLTNGSLFGLDTSSIGGSHVRHVLKISFIIGSRDCYLIGTYDTTKDIFIPDKGFEDSDLLPRFDYGKLYASKTFYDGAKKRRVLWGWINESSSQDDNLRKGWAGIQAIPRTLWFHKSGKQLIQWPVKEIEKLRTKPVNLHSKILKGGTLLEVSGVTAAQADVEISFEVNKLEKAQELDPSWKLDPQLLCSGNGTKVIKRGLGPFGLLVLASKGMQEYTSVFFTILRANKNYLVLMCSDQSKSSLNLKNDLTTYGAFVDVDPVHQELSLRCLIDHSVVESFGAKGKACIAARVYPTLAINDEANLHAFNNGTVDVKITRLSAWSMKKAKIN